MKNILVTGAAGGMGKSICKLLTDKGYKVYGLDYRESDDFTGTEFYQCDVTDMTSVEAVFEKVKEKVSVLDAIVHTAGIYDLDSLIEMDEARDRKSVV